MEPNKSKDFKTNVVDFTKIPPNEFEKYFQDWMERDDIARSLQAKLRCDLIKNFNKTNLGKHILSHTMTSSGGTSLRLTLSPLVLALNTLVAEFLYAQNCHFTLSVFSTEIPFRNTLPDFESMRRFRFNNEEICEIWQAVTGYKANIRDLNQNIIQNYEKNPNVSLLLLVMKFLLKTDPLKQLKRNVEVQTDLQEKLHKSVTAHDLDNNTKSSTKTTVKDDNFHYINKYLLTLSEKVMEMTNEFEQFAKQRREPRSRHLKSMRSREYYVLNKSLERITENMKAMAQAKRKNKRWSVILESIDNLTQEFGKCAQNFDGVTKVLGSKDEKPVLSTVRPVAVKCKEQQTETELQEKSYSDWINEMRNTKNGQRFLNKVEISLRKALLQHREQLKNETDIKMKHLKSLMKLHYQQKLSKHLLENPNINVEDERMCNENIEKKLQQFERKQVELLQKLQETTLMSKEFEIKHKEISKLDENEKTPGYGHTARYDDNSVEPDINSVSKLEINLLHSEKHEINIKEPQQCNDYKNSLNTNQNAQEEIMDIVQAKLRMQQLENESNRLEQTFHSYLERRKRTQEHNNNNKISEICSNMKNLCHITNACSIGVLMKPTTDENNDHEKEIEEEYLRFQEIVRQIPESTIEKSKSAKSASSTSSLEIRNAILEAKLKFLEHENTLRKCREQGEEIRSGNFLQKQLQKSAEIEDFPDYFNENFGKYMSETDVACGTKPDVLNKQDFNIESSLLDNYVKNTIFVEDQNVHVITDKAPASVRRELFPKDNTKVENDNLKNTLPGQYRKQSHLEYHRSTNIIDSNDKQTNQGNPTSKLIQQSMAKMQQLFEQHSSESFNVMNNELQNEVLQQPYEMNLLRSNEILDKSLTTNTITTTTTTTSNAIKSVLETDIKHNPKTVESLASFNHISTTSMPSLLNFSSESESSIISNIEQTKITSDTVKNAYCLSTTQDEQQQEATITHELLHHPQSNFQLEFGQLNDSPKLFDSPNNDKETGEVLTETNRTFAPTDINLAERFSSQSSSDFEISTGQQNIDAKNLADDSESDFWA